MAIALLSGSVIPTAHAYVPGLYFTELLTRGDTPFIEITNLTNVNINLSDYGFYYGNVQIKTGLYDVSSGPYSEQYTYIYDGGEIAGIAGKTVTFDSDKLLSLSGTLASGKSLIITNACDTFACYENDGEVAMNDIWSTLGSGDVFKRYGEDEQNFVPSTTGGRLNLFKTDGTLVDYVQYGANLNNTRSYNATEAALGTNNWNAWAQSVTSGTDQFGSVASANLFDGSSLPKMYGSPGDSFDVNLVSVPEPETYAMMLAGLGLIALAMRRQKQTGRIGT
jgi:hypothetical protein